jgi:hypothetical protein
MELYLMMDRILSVLVAISLALLVWLYARSRDQEILDNVPLPVQISLHARQSDQYMLEVVGVSQVLVTFSGLPSRIRELRGMLQRNELKVEYTLQVPEERLHETRYSDTILIEAEDIHAPAGVTPMLVEGRNRIPITIHRLDERKLAVRFDHASDDVNVPVIVEPATVLVRGPKEILDRIRTISTVPSLLPTRSGNSGPFTAPSARVALVQELEGRPVRVIPDRVTVKVPVQVPKKYELTDIPVQFLCPPNFDFRPVFDSERSSRISLVVYGPPQDELPRVSAFVDLSKGHFSAGLHDEVLQLNLPRDFTLMRDSPLRIPFKLEALDSRGPTPNMPGP